MPLRDLITYAALLAGLAYLALLIYWGRPPKPPPPGTGRPIDPYYYPMPWRRN